MRKNPASCCPIRNPKSAFRNHRYLCLAPKWTSILLNLHDWSFAYQEPVFLMCILLLLTVLTVPALLNRVQVAGYCGADFDGRHP
ncbi:MAG: hypothetical protein IPN76_34865 [Saprospiraceae bacterium]|nr:hypothetical protein [Saprospiraceae bacterium]